jgi:hypothetical protein
MSQPYNKLNVSEEHAASIFRVEDGGTLCSSERFVTIHQTVRLFPDSFKKSLIYHMV